MQQHPACHTPSLGNIPAPQDLGKAHDSCFMDRETEAETGSDLTHGAKDSSGPLQGETVLAGGQLCYLTGWSVGAEGGKKVGPGLAIRLC